MSSSASNGGSAELGTEGAGQVAASSSALPSPPAEPDSKKPKTQHPPPSHSLNGGGGVTQPKPAKDHAAAAATTAAQALAKAQATRLKYKRKAYAVALDKKGGIPEPIAHDVVELLGRARVDRLIEEGREWDRWAEEGDELVVHIERLSAHGDGLGVVRRDAAGDEGEETWVVAVPKALPGETVRVKVTENDRMFTRATIVEHVGDVRAPIRRDELVRCRYFATCSGCQYQMLEYDEQLRIKQGVVERAFALYSGLDAARIPAVLPTMASPEQYHYRTKLTPHFELPPVVRDVMKPKRKRGGGGLSAAAKAKLKAQADALELSEEDRARVDKELTIGFHMAGKGKVIDIEDCTIATATLNKAMTIERRRVKDSIFSYANGATLLLRDSLLDFGPNAPEGSSTASGLAGTEVVIGPEASEVNGEAGSSAPTTYVTVTDHKKVVLERVGNTVFESPAGTFFQNNRSILPDLVGYVRAEVDAHWAAVDAGRSDDKAERYLVDAYCGSGLFALSLAPSFDRVAGVEISVDSIKYAERNARLNGLAGGEGGAEGKDGGKVTFMAGKAEGIFGTVSFPPERTTLVIDPPRKGCDEAFIKQLIALGPALVIYVSCNVHTQARDVGQILRQDDSYTISSIRGADLFPQTHHVEGVCILKKDVRSAG